MTSRSRVQIVASVGLAAALTSTPASAGVLAVEPDAQAPGAEGDPAVLFDLAEQHYRQGRYEDAAKILARLAASIPDPVLFYNLGRAHESAGQLESAVEAYERYLELAPDAKDADAVAARVGRLRERIAEAAVDREPETPPPVLVQAPQDPTEARSPGARAAPWALLGVGGAGLVAGVAVALTASSRSSAARDEPVQARAADLDDEAQRFALAGNITMAVGGALAVAGLTWALVRRSRDRKRSVARIPGGLQF